MAGRAGSRRWSCCGAAGRRATSRATTRITLHVKAHLLSRRCGGWARREQALELLRRGWPPGDEPRYDPDHALVLCQLAGYRPGLVLLYEAKRLFREVLRVRALARPLVGWAVGCARGWEVPPGPGAAVQGQAPVPGGAV